MTTQPTKLTKALSLTIGLLGVIMLVVGVSVYAFTSQQLGKQGITVASVTPEEPGRLVGKKVAGPFTALAEANAIDHHRASATDGKTYGELGNVATSDGKTYSRDVAADASPDGEAHQVGDALSEADSKTYTARMLAKDASFLQASLFVSVLAFGVSALIAGLGLVFILVAATFLVLIRPARNRLASNEEPAEAAAS